MIPRQKTAAVLLIASMLAGCAAPPPTREPGTVAIVLSPYEPAAQLDPASKGSAAEGALLGAAGGAGIGAMSAKASAGLLCTIGGPLCLAVMIPAAIVGGLVGGVAGGVVDTATTDPGGRIAEARDAIGQALAEMRLTPALAAQARHHPESRNAVSTYTLEVGVTDLELLAREKGLAVVLRARSRLYRSADGELLGERVAQAQTRFRNYQEWAADGAQPLRRAIDQALAQLAAEIASDPLTAEMGSVPFFSPG